MPRIIPGAPLHRLHIMIPKEDMQWLEENRGENSISEIFRGVVTRLRGQKIREPDRELLELLEEISP